MSESQFDPVAIAREALTRLGGMGAGTLLEAPRGYRCYRPSDTPACK